MTASNLSNFPEVLIKKLALPPDMNGEGPVTQRDKSFEISVQNRG